MDLDKKDIRDFYLDETWLDIRKTGKKINTLCTFFQTGSCAHSAENCKFVHLIRKNNFQHNGRLCKNNDSKCLSSCMFYHVQGESKEKDKEREKEKESTFPMTTYAIPVVSKMSGDLPRFIQGQAPTILTPTIWQTPDGKVYHLMWVRDEVSTISKDSNFKDSFSKDLSIKELSVKDLSVKELSVKDLSAKNKPRLKKDVVIKS